MWADLVLETSIAQSGAAAGAENRGIAEREKHFGPRRQFAHHSVLVLTFSEIFTQSIFLIYQAIPIITPLWTGN